MGVFNLENFDQMSDNDPIRLDQLFESTLFMEAVFTNGKQKLEPLVKDMENIKNELETQIKEKKNNFDPKAFWKNDLWKDFENNLCNIFGFKNASIQPYIERYNKSTDTFESKQLNAYVYNNQRFFIEGLVTDNGFYDKSKSMELEVHVSLGLIKLLTAPELIAVLIHEFGHAIDPAFVDIKYHSTNVLSKYLTDREKEIKSNEKNAVPSVLLTFILMLLLPIILTALSPVFIIKRIFETLQMIFNKKKFIEKNENKYLKKIEKILSKDHTKFEKKFAAEAYADNFARMYGFGAELATALKKFGKDFENKINDRYKNELDRQACITSITIDMIKDVHKTDVHRVKNLINEYKKDIEDPNTPKVVKKQLKEDLKELEIILDSYTKDFSDFQNKINKKIIEELDKLDKEIPDDKNDKEDDKKEETKPKEDSNKNINESALFESKAEYEKIKKHIQAVTPEERLKGKRIFGDVGCTLAKDKNGYYFRTHRARTKSYENIEDIPKRDVKFVDGTC